MTVGSTAFRIGALAALLAGVPLSGCAAPTEIRDVPYDARHEATVLDVFLPAGGETARPAVMLVHGGAWYSGDKDHFERTARRLARSGYVAASIDYRLVPDGKFPRAVQDVGCALAFLQGRADEYGLDPDRVAIMGYSAGGHLVSLLGVAWQVPELQPDCAAGAPSRPAAVIPGAGLHDLRDADHAVVTDFLGGTAEELPEQYALASPILHIGATEPPFLLITGSADWFVDVDQSRLMRSRLRGAGNQAELLSLAGGGHLANHGTDPGEVQFAVSLDTTEAWLVLADFLERTVGAP